MTDTVLITRPEWGSTQTDPPGHEMGVVSQVVVHHYGSPRVRADASRDDESKSMRQVQKFHVDEREWDDYAYSFAPHQSGRLYEGRGRRRTGAHTRGLNSKSYAEVFPNHGGIEVPTDEWWHAAGDSIRQLIRDGDLAPDYRVSGHRDHASTACPGDHVYENLGRLRGLTVGGGREETSRIDIDAELVAMCPHPNGAKDGYWVLDEHGGVFTFGDVRFHGSIGTLRRDGHEIPKVRFVGISATPSGDGYYVADEFGGVFTFGDAKYRKSLPWGIAEKGWPRPTAKVVDIDADPDGSGYWILLEDGALYAFDADYQGRVFGEMKA